MISHNMKGWICIPVPKIENDTCLTLSKCLSKTVDTGRVLIHYVEK